MRTILIALVGLGLLAAPPANAIDLKKAKERPIGTEVQSPKSAADIERCIIDLDEMYAPIVYKQADRPDEATIVYANGGQVFGLIQLKASGNGTHVTGRSLFGRGGVHLKRGIEDCAA